jgi:hypothetical protein
MIDYHKQIVTTLGKILPTHYEMSLHSGLNTPCYSYMELNNSVDVDGDTLGYSRITYQVKVWANDLSILQKYALEADKALKPLGFKRIGTNELYDNHSAMIQKILTYEALALEEYE